MSQRNVEDEIDELIEDLSCPDSELPVKKARNDDDAHDNDGDVSYDYDIDDDSISSFEYSDISYEIKSDNDDEDKDNDDKSDEDKHNDGRSDEDKNNDDRSDKVSQKFLQEIEKKETNEKLFEFIHSNNLECNSPNFGALPHLAVKNIYKYLDYDDIQNASTICRSWRLAAKDYPPYLKNTIIKLNDDKLINLTKFSKEKQSSEIFIFKNFYLENIHLKNFIEFGRLCPENINEITFKNIEFFENEWLVLNLLKNLKELTLIKCKFVEFDTIEHEKLMLSNIEKLTINECKIIENTENVIIFIKQFQNLTYLKIFYPLQSASSTKPINFLESLSNNFFPYSLKLKEFHFFPNFINFKRCNSVELSLFNSNNISLSKFALERCQFLQEKSLIQILTSQTNLIHLNLSTSSSAVNNKVIEVICNNLKNLKELILQNSVAVTNSGLKKLEKLKNTLCLLDLRFYFDCRVQFTNSGIINGLAKTENLVLKELYLTDADNNEIIKMLNNLPNLEVLSLQSHFSLCSVDDNCLEFIVKNLRNLRYFNMRCSDKLSSAFIYLNELYSLRHLKLNFDSDVNYIVDIGNLKLKNLKHLELYYCSITREEFEKLSKNSPSIEYLSLCYCHGINCDTVISVLDNFHRLKVLETTKSSCINSPDAIKRMEKIYPKIKILLY